MKIEQSKKDNQLNLKLTGKLDVNTSPELKEIVEKEVDDEISTVLFDFENLEYISSVGLRVILSVLKMPGKVERNVIIRKPNEMVREIIQNIGFDSIMEIQDS